MSDLLDLTKKLIEFPSVEGNSNAINNCLDFCIKYLSNVYIKQVEKNGVRSILFSNTDNCLDFDVLEVGHIDVVPVKNDSMFIPKIVGDIMYARGSGDMKGSVAVAMKLFNHVVKNNYKIKYGLLIVSDEEPGGFDGSKYWAEELGLKAKIVLDGDAGLNLNTIIYKSKASSFIKLISNGLSSHGSKPWLGIDANENLINSITKIRKIFPYFSKNNVPKDEWTTTMHVGIINGGNASNSVSPYAEAILDFRCTEKYTNKELMDIVNNNIEDGVEAIFQEEGILVMNDIDNKYIQLYKNLIEEKTNKPVNFEFSTGASDSRYFSGKDTVIISNQADCGDLHGENEWVNIQKLKDYFDIRLKFIESIL